jgi:hypothetical protein
MKATDVIRTSLKTARFVAEGLLADMADAPLTRTYPETGNHPYWLLGHIVVSEAMLLDRYILGRPNRFEAWQSTFALGTTPPGEMNGGPTFKALLSALEQIRAASLEYLDTLSDADLDKPCRQPDGPGPKFDTIGQCLSAMTIHMSFHAGQVADARRAAGRKPLFM